MPIRNSALAFLAVGILGLPAVAQAETKTVYMGPPPAAAKDFQKIKSEVNDFFPHGVKIHAGGKVRFVPAGFHNVEFPKDDPTPLLSPTGATANETDAAGRPFWFNGQPVVGFTPSLVMNSAYGKRFTYDGEGFQSGLPLADKPKPFTMKFRKPGRFTYYCNVHFDMKGVVSVVPKGAKAPSKKTDRKALKRQVSTRLAAAKKLGKGDGSENKILVGDAAKGGVEYFDFVPNKLSVAKGTEVTFDMPDGSTEAHTATTGPGDLEQDQQGTTYLGKIAASFQGGPAIDPKGVYPSDRPGAAATLTKSLHGNGFWNTGVIEVSQFAPSPRSGSVRFGESGTFVFYCLIHPFMKAMVTVQ